MDVNEIITVLHEFTNKVNIENKGINGIVDLKYVRNCKKFICKNNQIKKLINIPDEIEYIDCSNNFIIELDYLPKNLKYLNCSHNKIKILNLKHKLRLENNKDSLIFHGYYSSLKYVDCSYNNIEEITEFYYNLDYFNCKKNPIKKMFYPFDIKPKAYPSTLEEITYGYSFDKPIDNLPMNIKKIIFFQRDEGHSHPTYFSCFNHPVDNLPEGLTHLELESSFNQNVDKLPSTVKLLKIGYNFDKTVDCLPSNLEELCISSKKFNYPLNNLPENLKRLKIGFKFNQEIEFLPEVTYLNLGNNFNKPISNLPNSIESLYLGDEFNLPIDNLPKNIKKLCIRCRYFDQYIDNLPDSIKYLKIDNSSLDWIKQKIIKLPKSLGILEIYNKRFYILENVSISNSNYFDNDDIFGISYYEYPEKHYIMSNSKNIITEIKNICSK